MPKSKASSAYIEEALHRIGKEVDGLFSVISNLDGEAESKSVGGNEIGGASSAGKPADQPTDEVSLTKSEIFRRAMDLTMKHGDSADRYVTDILRAIKTVNEAQLAT